MKKIPRLGFLLIIIFFLSIFLTAWAHLFPTPLSDADYVEDPEPIKLRVVSSFLNNELESSELEDFLKEHPKIELRIEKYPAELYYSLLSSELSYTDCPNIIAVEHPAIIDTLIPSNDLVPLNNHMISSYKQTYDFNCENSHYLSPPTNINSYVIYCNQDILNSLNIDLKYPTFDEFIRACESIKNNDIIPITLGTKSWSSIKNILIQLSPANTANPWQAAISNIRLLEPYFPKNAHLYDYHDSLIDFIQGNACFYFGNINEKEKIISESKFSVLITNLIINDKCTIWFDYTGMYALCMKSKDKLFALELLKYMTDKSEHIITQEYLTTIAESNNIKYEYKCNWMYDDRIKLKMYIEKIKNYSP